MLDETTELDSHTLAKKKLRECITENQKLFLKYQEYKHKYHQLKLETDALVLKLKKRERDESSDTDEEVGQLEKEALTEKPVHIETPRVLKKPRVRLARSKSEVVIQYTPDGNPILPIQFGYFTLHSLGIVSHLPNYHNEKYVFPIGYHITREYVSFANTESVDTSEKHSLEGVEKTLYDCRIVEGEDGPWFTISSKEGLQIAGKTLITTWSQMTKKVKQAYGCVVQVPGIRTLTGFEFFGLSEPHIKELIEDLKGADELDRYKHSKKSSSVLSTPAVSSVPQTLALTPVEQPTPISLHNTPSLVHTMEPVGEIYDSLLADFP